MPSGPAPSPRSFTRRSPASPPTEEPPAPVNNSPAFLPILLLGVVFWAMLIRPQQRARRRSARCRRRSRPETRSARSEVSTGSSRDIDDATVDIEVSEDVIVRFDRRAVSRIMRDVPAAEADRFRIGDDAHDDAEADDAARPSATTSRRTAADAPEAAAEPALDGSRRGRRRARIDALTERPDRPITHQRAHPRKPHHHRPRADPSGRHRRPHRHPPAGPRPRSAGRFRDRAAGAARSRREGHAGDHEPGGGDL